MESEDELALGGDRSPDPDTFSILFHFGYQFIKLQMANRQSTVEQSLMQPFTVMATSFNPAGDGGVVMSEDAAGGGDVNPFRHGGHDHSDTCQRRLQPIQGCAKATGSASATSLTLEVENPLLAATAVADKGMNRWVSNGKVGTQGIEASMTAGVDRFRPSAATLAFRPGQHIQFGAMREKADIAVTLGAIIWRFRLQSARTATLPKEVMPPTADATTVFGQDVGAQADKDKQYAFEGS